MSVDQVEILSFQCVAGRYFQNYKAFVVSRGWGILEVKLGKNAKITRVWMKQLTVLKLPLLRFYSLVFGHWSHVLIAPILNSHTIYSDLTIFYRVQY